MPASATARDSSAVGFLHRPIQRYVLVKFKLAHFNLLLLLLLHPFNGIFSRTTWVSRYRKGKTNLDLNEARDDGVLGCSGISWTTCKQSAPRCRQTTTPTPHHSIFTGRMRFLPSNQQCQSTEGHTCASSLVLKYTDDIKSVRIHDAARSTTGWTRRFAYSFNQSNAPHRLLPTQPPCCARRPSDVILSVGRQPYPPFLGKRHCLMCISAASRPIA